MVLPTRASFPSCKPRLQATAARHGSKPRAHLVQLHLEPRAALLERDALHALGHLVGVVPEGDVVRLQVKAGWANLTNSTYAHHVTGGKRDEEGREGGASWRPTWFAKVMTRLESGLGGGKRCFSMLATRVPSLELKRSKMRCG